MRPTRAEELGCDAVRACSQTVPLGSAPSLPWACFFSNSRMPSSAFVGFAGQGLGRYLRA
ncbi:hypothetical protein C8Q73DRAFT_706717 [Cubamyces lactineus]|nr:hypothetical protein C8Q73DRAFT_706717 [Cubamyces lactineus]